MDWICLIVAGLLEVVSVVLMKRLHGFRLNKTALICIATLGGSLFLLSLSLASIPVGTAYAIWTGIGSVGAVIVGMIFFNESYSLRKTMYIAMIVIGIVGLKLTS